MVHSVEFENDSGQIVLIDLQDTLFVPDLKIDLFSTQASIREARVPSRVGNSLDAE